MSNTTNEDLQGTLAPTSDSLTYHPTLREANITRQREWDTGNQMTLSYSGNELAGEVGEAIEAAAYHSFKPTAVTKANLADELGDVVICCDLLAMRYDIPLPLPPHPLAVPFDREILFAVLVDLAIAAGAVSNIVKKLEREAIGMKGSRSTPGHLADALDTVLVEANDIAARSGLVLADCVASKFNATSEKVGLKTRLLSVESRDGD